MKQHAFRAVLAVVTAALLAPPAQADPALSVVGGKVVLRVAGDDDTADVHLVLGNDGSGGDVVIRLLDTSGKALDLRLANAGEFAQSARVPVAANQPTTVDLTVRVGDREVDGTVIAQPTAGKAATAAFATERTPAHAWLWLTAAASAVVALLAVALAWLAHGGSQPGPGDPMVVGEKWSFKDSWAGNITALGAVAGTVLGATGVLNEFLHGVSVASFLGMTLLYGAIVLLAPLVLGATTKAGAYTVAGFLLAGWLTLAAALGQLSLLLVMATMAEGGAGRAAAIAFVVLGMVVLLVYCYRTISHTVGTDDKTQAIDMTTAPRRRAAML